IPVWYCEKCNKAHKVGKGEGMVVSFNRPEKCPICQGSDLVQDEQVLDTWFSSGLWPISTLGWPTKGKYSKYFPWNFEISAPEIKYLWISRMIMLSLHFTNEIPFKNMFFHGMLRDLKGQKFSKSLGNGIDPNELIKQWGVDSVRMALYGYSIPGRDGKTSKQLMDERCKNYRNFGTKLKNIFRFIIELSPEHSQNSGDQNIRSSESQNSDDSEILKKLKELKSEVTKNIETFSLHLATDAIYNFVWHDFADIYIEKSKTRREETQPILEKVLKDILILLHPFMPFLTEELYQKLPEHKESIMLEKWPL
ncbi:MAG: class I tRNA ligase family protein, partial [Patescibacteria group bacterium]|nr:class I tRNA ligase family protein [Patescibacteria group bacterium]